ncbi:MAG: hypothetical protein KIT84_23015 [Labilithrix sp.]|nr:hypothetical protein [Labilithrix sp.]MCW5813917.1 hypothetical protein [Labilithrix sp.]
MSKQTHSRWRGDPTRGAELGAPTAPHAQPTAEGSELSGPARFWSLRRARIAFVLALVASSGVHWYVAPWNLLPQTSDVEFKDPAGELAIPVDMLGEEEATPPPPEPAPPAPAQPEPTPNATDDQNTPGKRDAGPPPIVEDAGVPLSTLDAGAEGVDGGEIVDAGVEDGDGGLDSDAGLVAALGDAGTPGADGPRDPAAMFGLSKIVNTGVQNIVLGVNTTLVRQHPVGGRLGPVLMALPQWRDFFKGSTTTFEPVRDSEWILIYGPSLIRTEKDAMLVKYNVDDAIVDRTISDVTKASPKGGPFDAGVPGVKASLGFADRSERVFLRPQPHLMVIVPPSHGHEAALVFKKQTPKGPSPAEAMRLIVKNPSQQIAIRGLKFAESLSEIRLWIIPRDDGGADVYAEGDNTDAEAAADNAERLNELLRNVNSIGVRIATRGLLNQAKVDADGKKIKLHVVATQEQLEAILQLVAASLNVTLPPPPAPPASASGASGTTFPPHRE